MKRIALWTAVAIVAGGLALVAYAQPSASSRNQNAQNASGTLGPGMMSGAMYARMYGQHMPSRMYENMMASCRQVLDSQNPSPAALLAFQNQLKLTSQQVGKLQAIQQQASRRAEKVLKGNQLEQYQALVKSWGPQRMMQGHAGMMGSQGTMGPGMMGNRGAMGPGMMSGQNPSASQPAGGGSQ
jgi:hypothetical protein